MRSCCGSRYHPAATVSCTCLTTILSGLVPETRAERALREQFGRRADFARNVHGLIRMDGIHDLGGKQGFGAIDTTQRPVGFEARWHARVFAIMRATGVIRNSDQFRHAIERIDPIGYLTHGYYGRWLGGMETLLIEAGVLTPQEIAAAVDAKGGHGTLDVAARPEVRPLSLIHI